MTNTGTPPVIPSNLQQYNFKFVVLCSLCNDVFLINHSSYVVDPQWQHKFSIIRPSVLSLFVVLVLPRLIRSIRNRRAYSSLLSVREDLSVQEYDRANGADDIDEARHVRKMGLLRKVENYLGVCVVGFYGG